MSKQRRTFSAEFKREAAALVLDQGYSHIDACRSLGVVDSALRRWVKQLEAERQGVTRLMVKRRRRRHGVAVERERLSLPSAPNQVWSMDFVFDALSNGRRIKCPISATSS